MSNLVRMDTGTFEIESPIFRGSITIPAAREFAARLTELANEAQPFESLEEIQTFIYAHMKGSSISAFHDGICASSLSHGAFRGYVAHRGPNDRWEWRYGLDGSIEQRERSAVAGCTATDPRGRKGYHCCYREGHSDQFAHRFVREER